MKKVLAIFVVIALALSASASAVGRTDAPPASARGVAEKLMDETMDRSARLERVVLEECVRSPGPVRCWFVASGRTKNVQLDCRFKIVVETDQGHPVGRIADRSCDVDLLPKLPYDRAYEAVTSVVEMQLGPGSLFVLARTSRTTFLVTAGRAHQDPGAPFCYLNLAAEGSGTGAVAVVVRDLTCVA